MLQIDKNLKYDAKMGVLVMKGVSDTNTWDTSRIISKLHEKYGHADRKVLKALYPINNYIAYYKSFGYSYPVLNQLESILQGKKSPQAESSLLSAMFLSELNGMLLTAGHDFDKLCPPFCLKCATGEEHYQSISGREVTAVRDDLMLSDSNSVISSILRGPDYESRITSSTKDVLFTLYAPAGIDAAYIEDNLRTLRSWILEFSPDADTALLCVYSK